MWLSNMLKYLDMKRVNLAFTAMLLPLDYLALLAAGLAAYSLRFAPFFVNLKPIQFNLSFDKYLDAIAPLGLLYLGIFALAGLYSVRAKSLTDEVSRIVLACTAAMAGVLTIAFFSRELFESRFIILAVLALTIMFVTVERLLVRGVQRTLQSYGIGSARLAVIGKTKSGNALVEWFKEFPRFGFRPILHVSHFSPEVESKLKELKAENELDGILLADPEASKDQIEKVKAFADIHHLTFFYSADLFPTSTLRPLVHTLAGRPLIEVPTTPLDGWGAIYKRTFDIIVSLIAIILSAPLMVIAGLLLMLEDGWPFIFVNDRVGHHGKVFSLYKLRSMWRKYSIGPQFSNESHNLKLEQELIKKNSERRGPIYKIQNDPRVTPIGRFIRATSIDEFPQFWNVLKGDMSLVGPRPHQIREVSQYKPGDRRVFTVKPGITGLAQISGRANLDFEDEVRLDMYYIENWSPWRDLVILLKTPLAVLFRKGAY